MNPICKKNVTADKPQKKHEMKNMVVLSILSALMFFLLTELQINQLRINAIFGTPFSTSAFRIIIALAIFAACTYGMFSFSRSHLGNSNVRYWSAILWLPFTVAMILAFANLFPITEPNLKASPVTGLFIISAAVIYPFYMLLISYIAGVSYRIYRNKL